ncbi:hypothetical protein EIB18_08755 [Caulobacter vibrioides]|uniref:hypothetical protein n=1 Tax=Caulobacter vibrioides TaxID=155892 RepID=UPI000BB50495|nr:hypothetical protein [Caulobacter vibrioides]ATC26749.1 hypothetical protein CA608_09055 [Caulobacter vibrioides]AZH12789.1 hypothetical protein EIB18_08755 [Caulobacter vibrioides]PLR09911.1 hypothetical protein CVUC_14460 [Caulobacter vibrioides]
MTRSVPGRIEPWPLPAIEPAQSNRLIRPAPARISPDPTRAGRCAGSAQACSAPGQSGSPSI